MLLTYKHKKLVTFITFFHLQVPHTRYTKRTVRTRLTCLEQVLTESSSLATSGRVDSAMVHLKGMPDQQAVMG